MWQVWDGQLSHPFKGEKGRKKTLENARLLQRSFLWKSSFFQTNFFEKSSAEALVPFCAAKNQSLSKSPEPQLGVTSKQPGSRWFFWWSNGEFFVFFVVVYSFVFCVLVLVRIFFPIFCWFSGRFLHVFGALRLGWGLKKRVRWRTSVFNRGFWSLGINKHRRNLDGYTYWFIRRRMLEFIELNKGPFGWVVSGCCQELHDTQNSGHWLWASGSFAMS